MPKKTIHPFTEEAARAIEKDKWIENKYTRWNEKDPTEESRRIMQEYAVLTTPWEQQLSSYNRSFNAAEKRYNTAKEKGDIKKMQEAFDRKRELKTLMKEAKDEIHSITKARIKLMVADTTYLIINNLKEIVSSNNYTNEALTDNIKRKSFLLNRIEGLVYDINPDKYVKYETTRKILNTVAATVPEAEKAIDNYLATLCTTNKTLEI